MKPHRPSPSAGRFRRVLAALAAVPVLAACATAPTDDTTPVPQATAPLDSGASPGVNTQGDAVGDPVESELMPTET